MRFFVYEEQIERYLTARQEQGLTALQSRSLGKKLRSLSEYADGRPVTRELLRC